MFGSENPRVQHSKYDEHNTDIVALLSNANHDLVLQSSRSKFAHEMRRKRSRDFALASAHLVMVTRAGSVQISGHEGANESNAPKS